MANELHVQKEFIAGHSFSFFQCIHEGCYLQHERKNSKFQFLNLSIKRQTPKSVHFISDADEMKQTPDFVNDFENQKYI